MAEMTSEGVVSDSASNAGVAPADGRQHRRWQTWQIALAYTILFGVAIGSIWMIDDHVLQATPAATMAR
jgi:hypothetical protein